MQAIGYRGCVGIGYRYDRRDGAYKVLDVNARVSGVFRLFAGTNDMDVVRACYLDLTGQQIPQTALRRGRKWMLEDDVGAALRELRGGRLTVAEWIRSLRGVEEWHWMAADDPVPFLVWLSNRARRVGAAAIDGLAGGYRSTPRNASATRATCPSVMSGKNGSAIDRAATSSHTGNSPSRWPNRSR
jgi:predicted ATP-grasp superfamily ATP-dependent carboligase